MEGHVELVAHSSSSLLAMLWCSPSTWQSPLLSCLTLGEGAC